MIVGEFNRKFVMYMRLFLTLLSFYVAKAQMRPAQIARRFDCMARNEKLRKISGNRMAFFPHS